MKDKKQQENISKILNSLKLYAGNHDNTYPSSLNELIPKYIDQVPENLRTNQPYEYYQVENGKDFKLCVYLDSCGIPVCYIKNGGGDSHCAPPVE